MKRFLLYLYYTVIIVVYISSIVLIRIFPAIRPIVIFIGRAVLFSCFGLWMLGALFGDVFKLDTVAEIMIKISVGLFKSILICLPQFFAAFIA